VDSLPPEAALGVLPLILWALVITISLKYCLFVIRADTHCEGGILALMPLAGATGFDCGRALVVMRLFGPALMAMSAYRWFGSETTGRLPRWLNFVPRATAFRR
jgi:K+ transporter